MTDAELICGWMDNTRENPDWWELKNFAMTICPIALDLEALHEVEAKLADIQWLLYCTALSDGTADVDLPHTAWRNIHATAEQKITALANVLDPERKLRGGKDEV